MEGKGLNGKGREIKIREVKGWEGNLRKIEEREIKVRGAR